MARHPDLVDSVKEHRRHVFVATDRDDWPERIDEGDDLVARIVADCAAATEPTKVTAIATTPSGGPAELWVFPEAYRVAVDERTWPDLRATIVGPAGPPPAGSVPIVGVDLFVCVHGARDERCGRCGPPLVEALRSIASCRPGWRVHGTSHVGGHRYAGNVIVHPPGDWYGYVTPADVDRLVAAIETGRVVDELWRGRMGR